MNKSSQWRAAFARHAASVYAAHPAVATIFLGGSTARGHADRYSDIELGVVWQRPPTDTERQTLANAIDGDVARLYPYDATSKVWADDYFLGRAKPDQTESGVLLELGNYTVKVVSLRRKCSFQESQHFHPGISARHGMGHTRPAGLDDSSGHRVGNGSGARSTIPAPPRRIRRMIPAAISHYLHTIY